MDTQTINNNRKPQEDDGIYARQAVATALTAADRPYAREGRAGWCAAWDKRTRIVNVWYSDGWADPPIPLPADWLWDTAQVLKAAGMEVARDFMPNGSPCLMVGVLPYSLGLSAELQAEAAAGQLPA